jgi:hypothetical protein
LEGGIDADNQAILLDAPESDGALATCAPGAARAQVADGGRFHRRADRFTALLDPRPPDDFTRLAIQLKMSWGWAAHSLGL